MLARLTNNKLFVVKKIHPPLGKHVMNARFNVIVRMVYKKRLQNSYEQAYYGCPWVSFHSKSSQDRVLNSYLFLKFLSFIAESINEIIFELSFTNLAKIRDNTWNW
jgi:hypothetical protein